MARQRELLMKARFAPHYRPPCRGPAAIFSHGFWQADSFGACTVCLRLLDLQLHILIPSQGSHARGEFHAAEIWISCGLVLGFQRLFRASVNLGPETGG